jgi:hypothetical protein
MTEIEVFATADGYMFLKLPEGKYKSPRDQSRRAEIIKRVV